MPVETDASLTSRSRFASIWKRENLATRAQTPIVIRDRAVVLVASFMIFLPSFLFATVLRALPAALLVAGCIGALVLVLELKPVRTDDLLQRPLRVRRLLGCIGLALVIFLLGGETHLFYATDDWLIRDAVLADLVRHGNPVLYDWDGTTYLLRAPLGMYMAPAFVGQHLGLFAAHVTLLAQNAILLGAIFYLLMSLGRGWANLAILVAFGGLSILGALFLQSAAQVDRWDHLIRYGLDSWHPYYQYSSSIVQFFWVPNHALPGWWLATLFLLHKKAATDVATIGVSVAGLTFWSPLAVLPFIPWLLVVMATEWKRTLFAKRTWIGCGLAAAFLPMVAYLVVSPATIAHDSPLKNPDFLLWYVIFISFALPVVCLAVAQWQHIPREWRALFVLNTLILLALPFFSFGPNNDLVMRGSIAPLVILAFVFGTLAPRKKGKFVTAAVGSIAIGLGSVSAMLEVHRAVAMPRYAVSTCSLQEATLALGDTRIPTNYIAPAAMIPDWLIDLHGKPPIAFAVRACWPDRIAD